MEPAFGRRCILAGCVASPSNTLRIHGHPTTHTTRRGGPGGRRALPARRLAALAAPPFMSWVLALLSGALLVLSFPRYGHAAVAFVAVVPLLVAVSGWRGRPGVYRGTTLRRGFALGTVTGLVYFGGTVYWTGAVVSTFGGLPQVVALLCAFALAAYMTIYLAASAALVGRAVALSRRPRLVAGAGTLGGRRVRPRPCAGRVSLGAARQQHGAGAAGGPAGEPRRRLRRVALSGGAQRAA